MAQYLRPNSTIQNSGCTPIGASTCHECIDETSPYDGDYVRADDSGDYFRVGLSSGVDPISGSGHVVRWRWGALRYSTPPEKGSVFLYCGGTLIATAADEAVLPLSMTTESYTLTSGEADAITDYADLSLWFECDTVGASEEMQVSWAEIEIPDAPSAGKISNLMLLGVG